jgi:pimeloyl-ACP methyl ester carboxylesterase
MKLKEKREVLHPEKNVNLELKTFYKNPKGPIILDPVGLGGYAENTRLVKGLISKGFVVKKFSPRNSGKSTGYLTLDNYITDTIFVTNHIFKKTGIKPYGIGHSMGGYVLAHILGKKACFKKVVLLSPLIKITEQNPRWLNHYLKKIDHEQSFPNFLRFLIWIHNKFMSPGEKAKHKYISLDQERFNNQKEVFHFLDSLYSSQSCNSRIKVPSYIILTGKTNIGTKIHNILKIKNKWKKLQSLYYPKIIS